MRKLIVSALMSLDGVVDAPEKLLPYWNDENKAVALEELGTCDALFFGRVTYGMFAASWSSRKDDAFAVALNAMPKYVASRTLWQPPWPPSTVLNDVTELATLKKQRGANIMKYGIGQVDGTLIQQGLVDELRISVVPVILGAGRHLFEGLPRVSPLHTKTKVFGNGIVRLFYELKKG